MDEVLARFVRLVEERPVDTDVSFQVWLLVDGAILAGTVISSRRYFEEIQEFARITKPDDAGRLVEISSLSELGLGRSAAEPSIYTYVHLLNVRITVGGQILNIAFTRVRSDRLIAWGLV